MPFALPPDVLLEQRGPQLQQLLGTLVEHTQDRLPVGHLERHDPGLAVVGAFEPFGGVDELSYLGEQGLRHDLGQGDITPAGSVKLGADGPATGLANSTLCGNR